MDRRITKFAEGAFEPVLRLARPQAEETAPEGAAPSGLARGNSESLLDTYKYKAYLVVILIGMFSALVSWRIGQSAPTADAINGVTNPALAAFCVLLVAALLWGRESAVWAVERVGYVGIIAYFVADKYYVVFSGDLRAVPVDSVSEVFNWTPVLYILAYLIFGARKGLAVSAAFYSVLLGAGAPHIVRDLAEGDGSGWFNAFVQFYLANVVIVVLLYVFARFIAAYLKTHALNEASQKLAHTDFVTGVPNRRHLYAVLEWEISEAPQEGRDLAVIMFDLDHFKRINDGYGHDAGDRVLERVAKLVSGHLRAPNQLSRWGGEEFLILSPGTKPRGAEATGLRLRDAVEAACFYGPGSERASLGVAA